MPARQEGRPMRRRDFISLIVGTLAVRNTASSAQRAAIPTIGFLSSIGLEESGIVAFRRGLSEAGYVQGQNVSIEFRHADGNYERLSDLAAELASLPVS